MIAAYADDKISWHVDRIADLRDGYQARPVTLQLIISDYCNHSCEWCAYRAEDGLSSKEFGEVVAGQRNINPKRRIPTDKVMEILRDAKRLGVKGIIFTGGGEPTAHPDHIAIFSKALDLGFDCALNTNGNILREGWKEILPRFRYVRVSLDAANAQEHSTSRRVPESAYDTCLSNIASLARERELQGTDCTVGVGYVVTPTNYGNLSEGAKRIRDAGADYVRFAAMQSLAGAAPFQGHMEAIHASIAEAKKLETSAFRVVDLFDSRLGRRPVHQFCGMQQIVLYVGGNQKVYRCCYTAYNQAGEIGDLSERSLWEWFHSDYKREAIDRFDARSCESCPLEDKNDAIRHAMAQAPQHVNFV